MQLLTDDKEQQPSGQKDAAPTNRAAFSGLLLAFALMLSYIETLIPLQVGIPGIKMGLSNLAVVLSLYLFDWKEAFLITTLKALISGLLFGNLFMIIYSLAGAWLSCIVMIIMQKSNWFHIPVVSAAGGVMHNAGQLIVAVFIVKTYGVLYYAPVLIIAGLIVGMIIGAVASLTLPHIQIITKKGAS